MTCQFCRGEYPLALSHALKRPEWRYRIAQPIRHDQIQALLPALAAASTLAQFRHVQEADPPLVLGLQIKTEDRTVEVDLAAYFGEPEWVAVLGEVKYHNRVDVHDVANLEYLRDRLMAAGVRTVLMFATLKESFGDDEILALRGPSERSPIIRSSRGQALPNMPLVLTNMDLSRHPWDEEQPWRWEDPTHSGVLGTAIASCRRNLGLDGYDLPSLPDGRATLSWS